MQQNMIELHPQKINLRVMVATTLMTLAAQAEEMKISLTPYRQTNEYALFE